MDVRSSHMTTIIPCSQAIPRARLVSLSAAAKHKSTIARPTHGTPLGSRTSSLPAPMAPCSYYLYPSTLPAGVLTLRVARSAVASDRMVPRSQGRTTLQITELDTSPSFFRDRYLPSGRVFPRPRLPCTGRGRSRRPPFASRSPRCVAGRGRGKERGMLHNSRAFRFL